MIGTASPGPWVIQDNAGHGIHIYSAGGAFGGGKHVAKVSNSAGVDIRANAKLIVAAPAMLDALRDIAAFQDSPANRDLTFSEAVARMAAIALSAIAKAGA